MSLTKIIASFLVAIAIFISGSSCSKSGSGGYSNNTPPLNNPPATGTVDISGMAFVPSTLTVKAGTKITWTNKDGYNHTVTSDDGSTFSSGNIGNSVTYTFTPASKGTINYHCNIHTGMTATIIVTE